jgi:hypothetical protein
VPAGQDATLQVIAWSGERASEAASLEIHGRALASQTEPRPITPLRKPRLNAVLIGVSNYADPNLRLKFAAKDAQDLAVELKKQQGGLYDEVNIQPPLVDGGATKQNILDALASLAHQGPDTIRPLCSWQGTEKPRAIDTILCLSMPTKIASKAEESRAAKSRTCFGT